MPLSLPVVDLGVLICIKGGFCDGSWALNGGYLCDRSWDSYLISQVDPPVVVLEALFVGSGEAAEFTAEDLAFLSLVNHPDVDLDGT